MCEKCSLNTLNEIIQRKAIVSCDMNSFVFYNILYKNKISLGMVKLIINQY